MTQEEFNNLDVESQRLLRSIQGRMLSFEEESREFNNERFYDSISQEIAESSPFSKRSVFYQSEWKKRLIALLRKKNITEFEYTNQTNFDGYVQIKIQGKLNNNSLTINISSTDSLSHLKFKRDDKWEKCNTMYNEYETSPNFFDQDLDNRTYEQIYREFENCKRKQKQNLKKQFNKFVQDINNQLANPFYRNLDIAVNIQVWDKNNQVINNLDTTVKTNPKNKKNKINIQFFLREDGSISVNHQFSEDYLKEFENRWKKEAKARGMKVDVPEMRKDIIKYLNSQEAEASFGKKFLREIRTWYDASVAGYIEGIQATQKVTTHIWEKGTINQSTWYSKDKEHTQWPTYMQYNPIVGGATDGVVDEIVGIPMACKSVYELATEDEKRKALGQMFTSEGFTQMLEGMKKEAIDVANDQEKLGHFTGQTTISVASMLIPGGAITKTGKLDEFIEVVEQAVKRVDVFPNAKLDRLKDLVKKSKRTVVEELELKKIINEIGDEALSDAAAELLDLANLAKKQKRKFTWEEIKAFFKRGNDFNRKSIDNDWYPENEIWLTHPNKVYPKGHKLQGKPRRYRLDSWDYNGKGKIVSRKATDLEKHHKIAVADDNNEFSFVDKFALIKAILLNPDFSLTEDEKDKIALNLGLERIA